MDSAKRRTEEEDCEDGEHVQLTTLDRQVRFESMRRVNIYKLLVFDGSFISCGISLESKRESVVKRVFSKLFSNNPSLNLNSIKTIGQLFSTKPAMMQDILTISCQRNKT